MPGTERTPIPLASSEPKGTSTHDSGILEALLSRGQSTDGIEAGGSGRAGVTGSSRDGGGGSGRDYHSASGAWVQADGEYAAVMCVVAPCRSDKSRHGELRRRQQMPGSERTGLLVESVVLLPHTLSQ